MYRMYKFVLLSSFIRSDLMPVLLYANPFRPNMIYTDKIPESNFLFIEKEGEINEEIGVRTRADKTYIPVRAPPKMKEKRKKKMN